MTRTVRRDNANSLDQRIGQGSLRSRCCVCTAKPSCSVSTRMPVASPVNVRVTLQTNSPLDFANLSFRFMEHLRGSGVTARTVGDARYGADEQGNAAYRVAPLVRLRTVRAHLLVSMQQGLQARELLRDLLRHSRRLIRVRENDETTPSEVRDKRAGRSRPGWSFHGL